MGLPKVLVLLLVSWASVHPARAEWCYTEDDCGPLAWSTIGVCNGSRQSPVNINDSLAVFNSSLGTFNFTGYGNVSQLLSISNLGHTVEVELAGGASIAGGGLPGVYSAVAFHFHWGNGSSQPGSEHRINGRQFPMEMHIVHTKRGMNLTQAKKDPTGIAVLGFFIDVSEAANATAFLNVTSLLSSIRDPGSVPLNGSLSIDMLLEGVNHTSYYRYMGSLTTPTCDEAVVWTVFQNPILVPSRVVDAFPAQLRSNATTQESIFNVFRPPQPLGQRQVQTSVARAVPGRGSSLCPAQALALTLAFLATVKVAA